MKFGRTGIGLHPFRILQDIRRRGEVSSPNTTVDTPKSKLGGTIDWLIFFEIGNGEDCYGIN